MHPTIGYNNSQAGLMFCGVLYNMYQKTIPVPQYLKHMKEKSQQ